MKNFFVTSSKAYVVFLCVFCHTCVNMALFVSTAAAEPELYDFPVKLAVEADTKESEMLLNQKRLQAKKESISALLLQYNKKLSDEKALDYATYIMQAAEKFNQDPFVIAAMVVNESSARHDAVSKGGDYGLMQVRWRVHQKKIRKKYPHITEPDHMLDPEHNLLVGTEIFSTYRATAKQDIRGGLL